MTNAIIAQVHAQAQSQLKTTMTRQQKRIDRAQAEKDDLYAREDGLADEVSKLQAQNSEITDSGWLKKATMGVGMFFGFGDAGKRSGLKLEGLSVEQKRIDAELSRLSAEQARATQSVHYAIGVAQEGQALAQRGLDDQKAVADSRNASKGNLSSGQVAGGRGLAVEAAQIEGANQVALVAGESADRARETEQVTLTEAADTHAAAIKTRSGWSLFGQLNRLTFTSINLVSGVAAASPIAGFGILTPMASAQLGAKFLGSMGQSLVAAASGNGLKMLKEEGLDAKKDGQVAKAAELEVSALESAELAKNAEKRRQDAIRIAQDARATVSDLRDHNQQIRA